MENKKTLSVKAAVCDVRTVTEEALAGYERVSIACATLISNTQARTLLGKYPVEVKSANTIDAASGVKVSTVNGFLRLTPSQASAEEKTILLLNGSMDIAPGSEEALKNYAAAIVNGAVSAPESMAGLLSGFNVNGTVNTYPDGCIRLGSTVVLDRTFHLRAKQDGLYYAANRIVALSKDIDFEKLTEKNVRFATKKLLIAESLVEAALPLFDERADIQILPDGCAYLDDDTVLNESVVRRHGGKLCVNGDLTILEKGPWLDQVTCLRVDGDILVARELEDWLNTADADYETRYLVGGTLFTGRTSVHVTRAMLEGAENGLSLVSCAKVAVAEDIPEQLLREKLVNIIACAKVVCPEELVAAVELLSQDVALIKPTQNDEEEKEEKNPDEVSIKAAFYTF